MSNANEVGWWALYSRPRHEKKLADLLNERGIEAYTPVRKVLKQWSDRKKWVEEPLIRSYTFVRAIEKRYFDALNTHGAVRYVWFSGKAAIIPNRQILTLKALAGCDLEAEALSSDFKPGAPVKVIAGPLIGTIGELVSMAGHNRVIIRIDHIETVISVTISPLLLEKLPVLKEGKKEGKGKYERFW